MKLHLFGLPHTQTTREVSVCAFTQKLIKFCKMMRPLGYEIVLYAGDENDAECDELVTLVTREEQEKWYGPLDLNMLPTVAKWDEHEPPWIIFNHRAVVELQKRLGPEDLVLVTGGRANAPIGQAFPNALIAEWAAGYTGIYFKYVCFESYAWQSYLYGQNRLTGRWFDSVIPNFFDLDEWTLPVGEKDDYLLFVGRVVQDKGIEVANEIAKRLDRKLVMAGSGVKAHGEGWLETEQGARLEGNIEYVGTVGGDERNRLMANASVLLAPTTYIEPFGAVAVEAQLCGTPVVSTDWGAFPETVVGGLTGYRFRTLKEGMEAVLQAEKLDPNQIAAHARSTYSLEAIGPRYDQWFKRLATLRRDGWYQQ